MLKAVCCRDCYYLPYPPYRCRKMQRLRMKKVNLFKFIQPGSGGVWANISISIARY